MVADRDVEEALARSFLGRLPPEVVARLRAEGERADYPAGTTIYRAGSAPRAMLVVRGLFRVYMTSPEGRQVTVRYARAADVLGIAVLVGGPANVSGQALAESSLFRISSRALTGAARRGARVAWALAEELNRRLYETLEQTAVNASARSGSASPLISWISPPPSCIRVAIRLPADSTSTGGRLTAQRVTLLRAADGANAHHHAASAGGNGHAGAVIVLALLVIIIAATSVVIASPRWRRRLLRISGAAVAGLLVAYLVVRGIAEFFVINYSRPESYRENWGGPSLAGVLAVHSGPGLAILIFASVYMYRWRRAQRKAVSAPGVQG